MDIKNVLNCIRCECKKREDSELSQWTKNLWKSSLTAQISIHIIRFAVLLIQFYFNIFFLFLIAWKMEVDYIFPHRIFSSKKSTCAKILPEWKTAFSHNNFLIKIGFYHATAIYTFFKLVSARLVNSILSSTHTNL